MSETSHVVSLIFDLCARLTLCAWPFSSPLCLIGATGDRLVRTAAEEDELSLRG